MEKVRKYVDFNGNGKVSKAEVTAAAKELVEAFRNRTTDYFEFLGLSVPRDLERFHLVFSNKLLLLLNNEEAITKEYLNDVSKIVDIYLIFLSGDKKRMDCYLEKLKQNRKELLIKLKKFERLQSSLEVSGDEISFGYPSNYLVFLDEYIKSSNEQVKNYNAGMVARANNDDLDLLSSLDELRSKVIEKFDKYCGKLQDFDKLPDDLCCSYNDAFNKLGDVKILSLRNHIKMS